jgi:hypothetical protein
VGGCELPLKETLGVALLRTLGRESGEDYGRQPECRQAQENARRNLEDLPNVRTHVVSSQPLAHYSLILANKPRTHYTAGRSELSPMYDLRTYMATKDLPGGPFYVPEEHLGHDRIAERLDDRPLTVGKAIGGMISLLLLVATGAYLFVAL